MENYTKIFDNISMMVGRINDLEPGTIYKIFYILYVNDNVPIVSDSKNFTTRCIRKLLHLICILEKSISLTIRNK